MKSARTLLLFVPAALCLMVAGCGRAEAVRKNEEAIKEMIEHMESYAEALESVKDQESAKAAAAKIDATTEKLGKLLERKNDFPKLTKKENDALESEFMPKLKAATKRMQAAAFTAGLKSGQEPTFMAAIERMTAMAKKNK